MPLAIIVAMSENRCIGRNNHLPWELPDEWKYFRSVTAGKPFLMGRKSYESLDGLYSDYRNIIISHQKNLDLSPHPPAEQAHSLEEALTMVADEEEVFVLGGVKVFEELLPRVQRLYLSIIHAHIDGDVYFPEVDLSKWQLIYSQFHATDTRHEYSFSMNQYVRK